MVKLGRGNNMTITIAYLYYDILNLYGESGNLKILKYALEKSGYKVIIKFVTVDDILEFDTYDLVYMGMGIPENFNIIIKHLKKYKKDIKSYIENNKVFISTGNSYELFGKYIDLDNNHINTLGIFNFTSKIQDNRLVSEVSAKCKLFDEEIIGFLNTTTFNNNHKHSFLTYNLNDKVINEGVLYKNFIGTYVVGPILARNPLLLEYVIKLLIKDNNYKLCDISFIKEAYQDTITRRSNK